MKNFALGIFQKEPSVEEDEVEVGLDPLEQMDDFQELMFASHDDVKEQNQNGDSGNKEASAVHGEIDDFDEDSGKTVLIGQIGSFSFIFVTSTCLDIYTNQQQSARSE